MCQSVITREGKKVGSVSKERQIGDEAERVKWREGEGQVLRKEIAGYNLQKRRKTKKAQEGE